MKLEWVFFLCLYVFAAGAGAKHLISTDYTVKVDFDIVDSNKEVIGAEFGDYFGTTQKVCAEFTTHRWKVNSCECKIYDGIAAKLERVGK